MPLRYYRELELASQQRALMLSGPDLVVAVLAIESFDLFLSTFAHADTTVPDLSMAKHSH